MTQRFPSVVLPIIFATLVACSGYLFFTLRFGQPLREAQQATMRVQEIERAVDDKVASAIKAQLQSVTDAKATIAEAVSIADKTKAELSGKILVLEAQVAELKRQVALARMGGGLGGGTAVVVGGSVPASDSPPPQVLGTNEPTFQNPTPGAAPSSASPNEPVTSDIKDGLVFTLHASRISSRGIELDVSVMPSEGGEGYVRINAPGRSITSKARIVTADGRIIEKGSVGPIDGKQGATVDADLIEGVPTRFRVIFSGKFDDLVLCKRIEIEAFARKKDKAAVYATFENILVVPE